MFLLSQVDDEAQRERQIFYQEYADTTLKCSDGKTIRVSKAILSAKSQVFHTMFTTKSTRKVIPIPKYDLETFKTFLDCLMDSTKLTVEIALIAFPIAWEYKAKKCIEKCFSFLTPTNFNKDVCLALNVALSCQCKELIMELKDFLLEEKLFNKILDDEHYFLLLEPETMRFVLENIDVDSYVLRNVFKWGENYLKKNDKPIELKPFFTENEIDEHLGIQCFETTTSFFEFDHTELGQNYFTSQDFREFAEYRETDLRRCAWFKVYAGEEIVEKIKFPNVALLNGYVTVLSIYKNATVFYEFPKSEEEVMINLSFTYKLNENDDEPSHTTRQETLRHTMKKDVASVIKIGTKHSRLIDIVMEITYKFDFDCRVLKVSPKSFISVKDCEEKMYYTRLVEVSHIEKEKKSV